MIPDFLAIFLLGIAAGLRTFTAPAVLWLMRHNGPWAIVLAIAAVLEYGGDVHPKTPARTGWMGLSIRIVSGAFCGWVAASAHGMSSTGGAFAGVAGALLGAYGGLALRLRAIQALGLVPSGLLEDAVAIGLAVLAVGQL